MLADNEQWLVDNHDNLANNLDKLVPAPEPRVASEATLAADEEHILRCLGAALIMRWNTLQTEFLVTLGLGSVDEIVERLVYGRRT
jgi:hypothetical protein